MAATQVDARYNGIKTIYENGDGTGGMMVAFDSAQSSSDTEEATNVAASDTVVTLLAANADRKGGSVFNDADKALYLKNGAGASATSFKVKIAAGGYYEFPQPIYTGIITGIWDAAPTGSARISEES